jgi:transcriptional regulator with XRE-family HTH domain
MTQRSSDPFLETGTVILTERRTSRLRCIAPVIVASLWLSTGAAFIPNQDTAVILGRNYIQSGTVSGTTVAEGLAQNGSHDYGAMVGHLRQQSGLTWNELARALGVSRRAVHHWAAGQRLSEHHARRVEELAMLISNIGAPTPDQTRAALLSPGPDGRSQLSRFEEESKPRQLVPISTLTMGDFFDGGDPTEAPPAPSPNRASTIAQRRIPFRD